MDINISKILVLEDENLLLQAIMKKLKLNGFETVGATTAQQAFDYLHSMDELPDLIWLDYYLPDMDGLSFMHALKQDPKLAKIAVVVVSNSSSDEKTKSMLALGAKKYIVKAESRLDDIIDQIKQVTSEVKSD